MADGRVNVADAVDVVVIGGGPAGAAVALQLARWGHSVVIAARTSPLGAIAESIPPSARKLLDRLGILGDIDGAGFVRATGNTAWWGGETRASRFTEEARGYQVARHAFDALLLDLAADAGTCVMRNTSVRDVERSPGDVTSWNVTCDTEDGSRTLRARWVLDASGRTGVVARRGWRQADANLRTLALISNWERPGGWDLEDASHTIVESCADGWAWSVPVSATRRCIALMLDPSITTMRGRQRLESSYAEALGRMERLHALTAGAQRVDAPWACDASSYGALRAGEQGMLLVGDAASFIDPLSSFGVKKALASAWLAAVVVNTALRDEPMTSAALQLYEVRERAMYESQMRQSARFAQLAATGPAQEFWLDRASNDREDIGAEPDVAALRTDPDVLNAFESIRQRESITFRHATAARRIDLPVVRGDRIALAPHLQCAAFPGGLRYVRDVDLVLLADMSVRFRQVPDLFEAYNRAAPPVGLPDFLGALALLLGKGVLESA